MFSSSAGTISRSRNGTTCTVAKLSHMQQTPNHFYYSDPEVLVWESRRKRLEDEEEEEEEEEEERGGARGGGR